MNNIIILNLDEITYVFGGKDKSKKRKNIDKKMAESKVEPGYFQSTYEFACSHPVIAFSVFLFTSPAWGFILPFFYIYDRYNGKL